MNFIKKLVFDAELPDEKRRQSLICELVNNFNFIEKQTLSKSLLDREIPVLYIGKKEKSILLTGAYHGMEWLTSLVLLKFIHDLSEKINQGNKLYTNLLKKRGLTIVPCVNPDGVEISLKGEEAFEKPGNFSADEYKMLFQKTENSKLWQSNARGVDINHNFNAGWEDLHRREKKMGIIGPGKTRYGGICPESEPETLAITKLCRESDFEYAFAFHSQGEEIYWDYGKKTPVESLKIANILAQLSGYKVSSPEGLAVGGGFKDWFISEFSRPGFTIEIGKGKNPLPLSDFNSIYAKIEKMLYFIVRYNIYSE